MMQKLLSFGLVIALLPVLGYICMTLGFRLGVIDFGAVFNGLKFIVPALMLAVVVLLAVALGSFMGGRPGQASLSLLSAFAAFAMILGPLQMKKQGETVPPIHDISTDTQDPPAFVTAAPLRKAGENPAAYDRAQTARQVEAYPDLVPLSLELSTEDAFEICLQAVEDAGLELLDQQKEEGRIEAVATSRWFGFKDDVVLRIRPQAEGGSIVDIRSKSRIGVSDLGANAARIRGLREDILALAENQS